MTSIIQPSFTTHYVSMLLLLRKRLELKIILQKRKNNNITDKIAPLGFPVVPDV